VNTPLKLTYVNFKGEVKFSNTKKVKINLANPRQN